MRADAIAETTSQILHFDGKAYPCGDLGLGDRPDTVVSTKSDARTAEASYKKAGRVTRRVVRVYADGKQMMEVRLTPEKDRRRKALWSSRDEAVRRPSRNFLPIGFSTPAKRG